MSASTIQQQNSYQSEVVCGVFVLAVLAGMTDRLVHTLFTAGKSQRMSIT